MALLLVLVVDAFLGIMLLALLLPIKPGCLRLARPFVCPPGTEIQVRTYPASYHRSGEHGLEVLAVGPNGSQDVKVRALLVFAGLCSLVTLPLAIYLADLLLGLFNS